MLHQEPSRLRRFVGTFWKLANETLDEYSKDRGDLVAAALAFYTLLSLAPLIIVAVAIASFVLGKGAARFEVQQLLQQTMGGGAAAAVDGWVAEASRAGAAASIIGAVLTLFAASRFTAQLRSALNHVWNVDVRMTQGFKSAVRDYVSKRAFAFAMVLAAGPLLLAVFVSRALLTGLGGALFAGSTVTAIVVQVLQLLSSLIVVAVATAVAFRVVPDVRVSWGAIIRGALLTSVLFNIGNLLVGLYLGKANVGAAYGAAGSVIVVLLWLQFSAQMFLYGAEFTQVYARHHGAAINGAKVAQPLPSKDVSR